MALTRILVANRGEIAVRILQSCKKLGVGGVQAFSEADEGSLPVRMADRSVLIGGPAPADSYLNIANVIRAAKETGCDAVHPGYGFLSENPDFAEACAQNGLVFIGPSADAIRAMGNKAVARDLAAAAGVPVIPGSDGPLADLAQACDLAQRIGYPLLIKAAAGGGGRGMRVVQSEDELEGAFAGARREAETAFGNADVYLEKYLERVRHIEVQVIADGTRALHLGERDCSIQRRHQKLVEECPSPALSDDQRRTMTAAACRLAEAVGYRNAGTVEFVFDTASGAFYFIEMNTRVQVEHPVTEAVTGIDIVSEQIALAGGAALSFAQADVRMRGHAIECRINAEDPAKGFMPRPGTISAFTVPKGLGVRVDTHAFAGYALPTNYDSLIGKLIVHADTREAAIAAMKKALAGFEITGVPTTIPFHQGLMDNADFIAGDVHTRYVKEVMWAGKPMQKLL